MSKQPVTFEAIRSHISTERQNKSVEKTFARDGSSITFQVSYGSLSEQEIEKKMSEEKWDEKEYFSDYKDIPDFLKKTARLTVVVTSDEDPGVAVDLSEKQKKVYEDKIEESKKLVQEELQRERKKNLSAILLKLVEAKFGSKKEKEKEEQKSESFVFDFRDPAEIETLSAPERVKYLNELKANIEKNHKIINRESESLNISLYLKNILQSNDNLNVLLANASKENKESYAKIIDGLINKCVNRLLFLNENLQEGLIGEGGLVGDDYFLNRYRLEFEDVKLKEGVGGYHPGNEKGWSDNLRKAAGGKGDKDVNSKRVVGFNNAATLTGVGNEDGEGNPIEDPNTQYSSSKDYVVEVGESVIVGVKTGDGKSLEEGAVPKAAFTEKERQQAENALKTSSPAVASKPILKRPKTEEGKSEVPPPENRLADPSSQASAAAQPIYDLSSYQASSSTSSLVIPEGNYDNPRPPAKPPALKADSSQVVPAAPAAVNYTDLTANRTPYAQGASGSSEDPQDLYDNVRPAAELTIQQLIKSAESKNKAAQSAPPSQSSSSQYQTTRLDPTYKHEEFLSGIVAENANKEGKLIALLSEIAAIRDLIRELEGQMIEKYPSAVSNPEASQNKGAPRLKGQLTKLNLQKTAAEVKISEIDDKLLTNSVYTEFVNRDSGYVGVPVSSSTVPLSGVAGDAPRAAAASSSAPSSPVTGRAQMPLPEASSAESAVIPSAPPAPAEDAVQVFEISFGNAGVPKLTFTMAGATRGEPASNVTNLKVKAVDGEESIGLQEYKAGIGQFFSVPSDIEAVDAASIGAATNSSVPSFNMPDLFGEVGADYETSAGQIDINVEVATAKIQSIKADGEDGEDSDRAKATMIAYLINLVEQIETRQAAIRDDRALDKAKPTKDLTKLYQILGVLTAEMKQVFGEKDFKVVDQKADASLDGKEAPDAPPSGTSESSSQAEREGVPPMPQYAEPNKQRGASNSRVSSASSAVAPEYEVGEAEVSPYEVPAAIARAAVGDGPIPQVIYELPPRREASIAPTLPTEFRPKITAQKVFPAAVEKEQYLSKEEVEVVRDNATEMAYLAVKSGDKAQTELESYILQNYAKLEKCGILDRTIAKAKIANYDGSNLQHKQQVAQSAAAEISVFVDQCKTYEGGDALFDGFKSKIGFIEDAANSAENKISWVENGKVSKDRAPALAPAPAPAPAPALAPALSQNKLETFFWQRTFLAASRAQIVLEANAAPEIEMTKETELKRREKAKGKLVEKYSADYFQEEDEEIGLAKTSKVRVLDDESKVRLLTADGIAMHMSLFEAQDFQSESPFDVFSYLSYSDFAELSGKMAMIETDGKAVEDKVDALVKNGIEDLFGGYPEFGGYSKGDVRSHSLLPILWMMKEHAAQVDPKTKTVALPNGKTFGQLFAEQSKIENDLASDDAARKNAKAQKKLIAQDLIADLTEKSQADLQDLYKNAKKQVEDKAIFSADEEFAKNFYAGLSEEEDLDKKFEEAKGRLAERRQKSPPKISDVAAARLRMVGDFELDGDKAKLPGGWELKDVVVDADDKKQARVNVNNFAAEKLDYQFAATSKFDLTEFEKYIELETPEKIKTHLANQAQYSAGDEGLFAAPNSKVELESGFLITNFHEKSCLYDFAKAVEAMPSSASAKAKIAKGETVYNVALLSGDDGIPRQNRYAFVSQNNRGVTTTFATKADIEQEIFAKNAQLYRDNFEYEARLHLMQQAADISLVYLNNYIAKEYRKVGTTYQSSEDVLKLPHVIALSQANYDLNSLLTTFASKDGESVEDRRTKMDKLKKFAAENAPNLNPPFLITDAKNFDQVLAGVEAKIKAVESYGFAAAAPAASSSLAKITELKAQIKNPTELSQFAQKECEAKARKNGQIEMQNYLQEKDRVAALASSLTFKLDDKDVKVIEDDYYRLNSLRPGFTKGGKSALEELLLSDIPQPAVSGITIHKPRSRDGGKPSKAIVHFKLPTEDDIAWVWLPGSPECYVKVQVDPETGNVTIHPEIYHKNKEKTGYDPISADKKSLTSALGNKDGERVFDLHKKFNVLGMSTLNGVRSGVAVKFNGNIIEKSEKEISSKTTSATLNQNSSRAKNIDCKFLVDAKGRVVPDANAGVELVSAVLEIEGFKKSIHGATIVAASTTTLVDGVNLRQSFGEMKGDSNQVRIVLPVMVTKKGNNGDSVSFENPLIEYYQGNSTNPEYMPFNKANLSKLYDGGITDDDFNKFAARLEIQKGRRVPVVFEQQVSDKKTELQLASDQVHNIGNLQKEGKAPSSTCAVISAALATGQEVGLDNNKGRKGFIAGM